MSNLTRCTVCHHGKLGKVCRFCRRLVPVEWRVVIRTVSQFKYRVTTYIPIYPSNIKDYVYTESTTQD